MASRISEWIAEAGRRRVFRTTGVYIVAVWGISSGGVDIASVLGIPESAVRILIYAALGFLPVVVFLAWRFDIGRTGVVRDPQDLQEQDRVEAELADMPTTIGGDMGTGAVVVRWEDTTGENAALFLDEFYIGRGADCRVRYYDPLVSRRHARVFHDESVWYVEDLGSRNGTAVDGRTVEREPLGESAEIRVNDGGPFLLIERVMPGEATRDALSNYPPGQPTAHIRSKTIDAMTSGRPVARK